MNIAKIMRRCAPIGSECAEAVKRQAREFSFERGEVLVAQDKPCTDIIFFETGILRIALDKGKHEDTICFGGAGDVFLSFHTFYDNESSPFKLVALEKGNGWRLSIDAYRRLEGRFPELIVWMRNMLVEQLYSFEGLYRNFALSTPAERLERFWEATPEALRAISPANLSKTVALKYIAQYLGIAQQTLSRLRRKMVGK